MALAIDTNILIYAHFDQYPEHAKARDFLHKILSKPDAFYLGWQVYYEYLRLATHPKLHRVPLTSRRAAEDMKVYLGDPRCRVLVETESHENTIEDLLKNIPSARGNFLHDCHYAALLKEHAVGEIATADVDFKKFDFLKIINPVI
jgi:uncharacterized protein